MRITTFRNDTARQTWCFITQELDQSRIEGHERNGSLIAGKNADGAFREPRIAIKMAFELKQQCDPSSNKIAQFCQCQDMTGADFEAHQFDLSGADLGEPPAAF